MNIIDLTVGALLLIFSDLFFQQENRLYLQARLGGKTKQLVDGLVLE